MKIYILLSYFTRNALQDRAFIGIDVNVSGNNGGQYDADPNHIWQVLRMFLFGIGLGLMELKGTVGPGWRYSMCSTESTGVC